MEDKMKEFSDRASSINSIIFKPIRYKQVKPSPAIDLDPSGVIVMKPKNNTKSRKR